MKNIHMFFMALIMALSCAAFGGPVATTFVYPVGSPEVGPTDFSFGLNGFSIYQPFNAGPTFESGARCSNEVLYTNKADCIASGGKWMYGSTGVRLLYPTIEACHSLPVRAIADGVIDFAGTSKEYEKFVKEKLVLPNGKVVYSLYGHLDSLAVRTGRLVKKGDVIGYVGDSNGWSTCYVNFALYDEALVTKGKVKTPPEYLGNDASNQMKYFLDPLLFVSERIVEFSAGFVVPGYQGFNFSCCQTVLSKMTYLTDDRGMTKSLQDAVNANWIEPRVYTLDTVGGGIWVPNSVRPIEANIFSLGATYVFQTFFPNLTLHYFITNNEYISARWQQDMRDFAFANEKRGFGRSLPATYVHEWWNSATPTVGKAHMDFEMKVRGVTRIATVFISYPKSDPTVRYVSYFNPFTGVTSPERQVGTQP